MQFFRVARQRAIEFRRVGCGSQDATMCRQQRPKNYSQHSLATVSIAECATCVSTMHAGVVMTIIYTHILITYMHILITYIHILITHMHILSTYMHTLITYMHILTFFIAMFIDKNVARPLLRDVTLPLLSLSLSSNSCAGSCSPEPTTAGKSNTFLAKSYRETTARALGMRLADGEGTAFTPTIDSVNFNDYPQQRTGKSLVGLLERPASGERGYEEDKNTLARPAGAENVTAEAVATTTSAGTSSFLKETVRDSVAAASAEEGSGGPPVDGMWLSPQEEAAAAATDEALSVGEAGDGLAGAGSKEAVSSHPTESLPVAPPPVARLVDSILVR